MEYFVLLCWVYVTQIIKRYWPYVTALLAAFLFGLMF